MAENKKRNKFPTSPQGLGDNISKGMIERNKGISMLSYIRACIKDRNIIAKTFDVVEKEISEGNIRNAIELMKLAKESEDKNVNIKALEARKIFVSVEQKNEVLKHIEDVINDR